MTKQYTDMNQHDALYKVARQYPGGLEGLAQRMGISVNVLRNKLSPAIDSHYPSFEEVSEIIEYLVEAKVADALQPAHAFNRRHNLISMEVPCAAHMSDDQLVQQVCQVMKECGDVASSISMTLADRKITPQERDRYKREFREAYAALAQLEKRMDDRFDEERA